MPLSNTIKKYIVVDRYNLTRNIIAIIVIPEQGTVGHIYKAGQYVKIFKDIKSKPFYCSIANAANDQDRLEFHIKVPDRASRSANLLLAINKNSLLYISEAAGLCTVENITSNHNKIIFAAGGTGVAPIFAILEELACQQSNQVLFFWGNKQPEDFYYLERIHSIGKKLDFCYYPLLSKPNSSWRHKTGLIGANIVMVISDLSKCNLVSFGPVAMLNEVLTTAISYGLRKENFFSDFISDLKCEG